MSCHDTVQGTRRQKDNSVTCLFECIRPSFGCAVDHPLNAPGASAFEPAWKSTDGDRPTGELVLGKQLAESRASLGEQIIDQVEFDQSFFDLRVR